MIIAANGPFDFSFTYDYMSRQDDCLYDVSDGRIRKAEIINGKRVLFDIYRNDDGVEVEVLMNDGVSDRAVRDYVIDWLDLSYDLDDFYRFAKTDTRLSPVVDGLYGFRMVGKVSIVEAFLWAILGQQITKSFAYVLKRRVIEYFNHHINYDGGKYYLMPAPRELSHLSIDTLRGMQVSNRKAEYIIDIMSHIGEGTISKDGLLAYESYDEVLDFLVSFRGIGPWSANTILMRTLKYRNAVPIGDAGIKNALMKTDDLEARPSKPYIERETLKYGSYGMYATVYLWEVLVQ